MLLETLARDAQCLHWVAKESQTDGRGSTISSSMDHFLYGVQGARAPGARNSWQGRMPLP